MPSSNSVMIHKLQVALNSKGCRIMLNRTQFYSEEQKRPVTIYKVSQAIYDEKSKRYKHEEIFSSASEIQEVLFLRNLWYKVQGKDVPPTNEMKGAAEFKIKWDSFVENGLEYFLKNIDKPE